MLKIGIVGLKNSSRYISAINLSGNFEYVGIYDPMFQVDLLAFNKTAKGFLDLKDLLLTAEAVVFSADDKVFFPLIKEAICYSKLVFLDSVHKFSPEQIKQLVKLSIEADTKIQVFHPTIYTEVTQKFLSQNQLPLLYESEFAIDNTDNMLRTLREETSNVLFYIKSSIRKIRVNILNSCNEIPDIYNVCIDFNNGSFSKILVNMLNIPPRRQIKILGANSRFELDLDTQRIEYYLNGMAYSYHGQLHDSSLEKLVAKQLDEFYYCYKNEHPLDYTLDYEIDAFKVVDAVTDKLRVSINIL